MLYFLETYKRILKIFFFLVLKIIFCITGYLIVGHNHILIPLHFNKVDYYLCQRYHQCNQHHVYWINHFFNQISTILPSLFCRFYLWPFFYHFSFGYILFHINCANVKRKNYINLKITKKWTALSLAEHEARKNCHLLSTVDFMYLCSSHICIESITDTEHSYKCCN